MPLQVAAGFANARALLSIESVLAPVQAARLVRKLLSRSFMDRPRLRPVLQTNAQGRFHVLQIADIHPATCHLAFTPCGAPTALRKFESRRGRLLGLVRGSEQPARLAG